MDLFIIVITFASIVAVFLLARILHHLEKIATELQSSRALQSTLDTRLLQANGSLLEIAALLQAQRNQP